MLYFNPGSAGPRRFSLPVSVGRLTVSVASGTAKTKPILVSTGRRSITVALPRALWREGRYPIRLVTAAPTGKKTRVTTGTLVVF